MSEQLKYHLVVKHGKVEKEEGHFFVAAPFSVSDGHQMLTCVFKRDDVEKVVYEVRDEKSHAIVAKLEHPDYMVGSEPGKELAWFLAALFKIGIGNDKEFGKFYADEANVAQFSYEVRQKPFTF